MQLHLESVGSTDNQKTADPRTPRAIECDDFPFERLSRIAEHESWRKEVYRPIYHVNKWWAQRLGSVFRAIVLGALVPRGADVLSLFYSPVRFPDVVVYDPFMGSGTTLGETLKLGARAIGRDINPVSYLQVRTALTFQDWDALLRSYRGIEADVSETIASYYKTLLADGTSSDVLYYFWVMQVSCPTCFLAVDLFSTYVFAKHARVARNPTVHIVCPNCGALSPEHYQVRWTRCATCGHGFDAAVGPVKGRTAACPHCSREFAVGRTIQATGRPPVYRMYAKLVLTHHGKKEYHPASDYDRSLYCKAVRDLEQSAYRIPDETIEPGYNTNQARNYGFYAWNQMFNARQLLCISTLANRIKEIDDPKIRDAFTCLFCGTLEFNNMFASYKGEGTGAVRHMFYHHILKPERSPLEANLWGTPKSSGAFSTLFTSRLRRAYQYALDPFELALSPKGGRMGSAKVGGINEPLTGLGNCESYDQFSDNGKLYVSCGDSAVTDLVDECVDLVITDPPFFDNVHYSQLADFFYAWQKLILDDSPNHRSSTTRSRAEVQNADVATFTDRLALVFRESSRVLKENGLFVFTYHHSRWEGWRSVLVAITLAGLRIQACHPVKAEMAGATPKRQAKAPINFDIIMVCRKDRDGAARASVSNHELLAPALERARDQIGRLRTEGWKLSRNDVGVVVMAQVVGEVSRQLGSCADEVLLRNIEPSVSEAIDRLQEWKPAGGGGAS